MSTLSASHAHAQESTGHAVAGNPVWLRALAAAVITAILVSMIGLALTVSSGTTLATMSSATLGFGVLGAVGVVVATVMGCVELFRDN